MRRMILVGIAALLLLFAGCITLPGATPERGAGKNGQTGEKQTVGGVVEKTVDNLEEALIQNAPLECTATATMEGQTVVTRYWTKDGNVRTESEYTGQKIVTILKNKKIYIQASTFGAMPEGVECDWIEIGQEENRTETEAYSASVEDYENMSQVKVECTPGIFGNEKFETGGKICTMDDLIPPMEELPPGFEACEGLSGQALIDCLQQN